MLIDTHCHLYDEKIENPQRIIDNFEKDNILACVMCADTMENSIKVLDFAKNKNVYAGIGVHPETADNYSDEVEKFIIENDENEKVVAVGEIGLDYYHEFCSRELQKEVFIKQIKLAYSLKLPMIIHIREAYGDFLEILKEYKKYFEFGGVVHSFSGSVEIAKILIDYGFYLSFNGIATFKNANKILSVIKEVPLDKILVETDSPYLTPEPFRGRVNEPKYVEFVARKVAELKDMDYLEICNILNANAKKLFFKMKWEIYGRIKRFYF